MHRTGRTPWTRSHWARPAFGLAALATLIALTLSDPWFWRELVHQIVELIQEWDRLP
jgi:hypothetical protein